MFRGFMQAPKVHSPCRQSSRVEGKLDAGISSPPRLRRHPTQGRATLHYASNPGEQHVQVISYPSKNLPTPFTPHLLHPTSSNTTRNPKPF